MRVNETGSVSGVKGLENPQHREPSGAGRSQRAGGEIREDELQKDHLAPEKRRQEMTREEIESALEEFEEMTRFIDKGFEFNIHEELDRIWVEVIDRKNDEVVREIPPERILDVLAGLKDVVGLLVDKEA